MKDSVQSDHDVNDERINLWSLSAVPVRRWKTLAGAVVLLVLVALAYQTLRPKYYAAHLSIVPSTERGGAASSMIAAAQLPPALAGMLVGTNSNQRLIEGVLRSRSLADSMVARLGIDPALDPGREAGVRHILEYQTKVENRPDGSIRIEVRDRDPVWAARIANELPDLANVITARLSASVALRKQEFFENQLVRAHQQLVNSEERLVAFQLSQDAPEIQEQARRTMEAAAELQRQIMEQEITVSQLRRSATSNNPELRSAEAQLTATRAQLARITTGSGRADRVFVSMRESPELMVEAARLLRDFTKDEQVFMSLTAALTQAQIDANNNLPTISVLDPAIVPQSPVRLDVRLLLAMAMLLGLVLGVVAAFFQEYLIQARRDPASEQFFTAVNNVKSEIRGWLPWSSPMNGRAQAVGSKQPNGDRAGAMVLAPLTAESVAGSAHGESISERIPSDAG
jgi:tyrosine-protein kinase Etk/Wzc